MKVLRPSVAADVREALAPALGESLLGLDLDELMRRAEQVPMVASASFDRGFPHTLEIAVVPEVPVRGTPAGNILLARRRRRSRRRRPRPGRAARPAARLAEAGRRRAGRGVAARAAAAAVAAVAPLVGASASVRGQLACSPPRTAHAEPPLGRRASTRRRRRSPGEARGRPPGARRARRTCGDISTSASPSGRSRAKVSTLRSRSRLRPRPRLETPIDRSRRRRTLNAERDVMTPMLNSSFRSRQIETLLR